MSFQADDGVLVLFMSEGIDVDFTVSLCGIFSIREDETNAFGCYVFFADD